MINLFLLLVSCTSAPQLGFTPAFTLGPAASLGPKGFAADAHGVRLGAAAGRPGARFELDGEVRLGRGLSVRTTGVGRRGGLGTALAPLTQVSAPSIGDCAGTPCAQLRSPGLVESWTDHGDGLEQTWKVEAAPAGEGELVVELAVTGAIALEGAGATIRGGWGESWVVSGLQAWDADGVVLASRLEEAVGGLRVVVEDAGARYPVWVDPVYSEPDFVLNGTNYIVAGGRDVNGDGQVDVAMSSHDSDVGYVCLYVGTPSGFGATATTMIYGLYDSYYLDYVPIAFAGDVNGDGYDEVIVSAPLDERVNIYAGAANGIADEPSWTLPEYAPLDPNPWANPEPVASVAGAGDVNGDGYDDVIVGVPSFEAPGHATVYLGSASGVRVDESAVELQTGASAVDVFGYSVAGAGDVNSDGYDDVIVGGNPGYSAVYYGSLNGVSEVGVTLLEVGGYARAVAGAGDVNADGYADILVGAPSAGYPWADQDPADSRGSALLFLGGPTGIASSGAWQHDGRADHDLFGFSVAGAGDVNADGYADVITGTEQEPQLFVGGSTGLGAEPVARFDTGGWSVSGAGDVDHDGLDDVVVGGGRVYLASTFLDSANAACDPDTNCDTGGNGDSTPPSHAVGCGGEKQGCASTPEPGSGRPLVAPLLALAALRRRVLHAT